MLISRERLRSLRPRSLHKIQGIHLPRKGTLATQTSLWKVCMRNFTVVAVHISVYLMYTVRNRRYTGRYVNGVHTKFYSCGKVPSSSVHMSVCSMYTGRLKGYTECGVERVCTDFVYLVNNEPSFLAGMKFVCKTLSDIVFKNANLRSESA